MRTRVAPEERREQLLASGRELWAERSYDDINSRQISDAAGVSIGLVYHYFGSKRGYFVATIRSVAEALLERVQLSPDVPLGQALELAVTAFVEQFEAHAALYRATLRGGVGIDPEVSEIAEAVRREIVDRIVQHPGAAGVGRAFAHSARRRLYGWLGFVESVALDWADRQDCPSGEIVDLALEAFGKLLGVETLDD